jgi:hypothetical protein
VRCEIWSTHTYMYKTQDIAGVAERLALLSPRLLRRSGGEARPDSPSLNACPPDLLTADALRYTV